MGTKKTKTSSVKQQINQYNNVRLWIGTPLYGGQGLAPYIHGMIDLHRLCDRNAIAVHYQTLTNESLITRARNRIVNDFLKSNATHLLFIDGDIGFNPADVLKLIDADKDIIGGTYPRKTINWESVIKAVKLKPDVTPEQLQHVMGSFVLGLDANNLTISLTEPSEVKELGTGFMLIKREVFERLLSNKESADAMRHFDYHSEQGDKEIRYAFFETVPDEDGRMLSEDFFFCWLAKKYGASSVWTDLSINLTHTGTMTFIGNAKAQAVFQQLEAAKASDGPAN